MTESDKKYWLDQAKSLNSLWALNCHITTSADGDLFVAEYDDEQGQTARVLFDPRYATHHAIDLLKTTQHQLSKLPHEELVEVASHNFDKQNEAPLSAAGATIDLVNGKPTLMVSLGSTFLCFHLPLRGIEDLRQALNELEIPKQQ